MADAAQNGWLRDNIKTLGAVLALVLTVGGVGSIFVMSRAEATAEHTEIRDKQKAHAAAVKPHPAVEEMRKLLAKHAGERMDRIEKSVDSFKAMLIQSTPLVRRDKVQAIADETD